MMIWARQSLLSSHTHSTWINLGTQFIQSTEAILQLQSGAWEITKYITESALGESKLSCSNCLTYTILYSDW